VYSTVVCILMWHFAVRLRRFHIVSGDVMWLLLLLQQQLLLQPFNGLFSRTSLYQKGKTNLVLNEAKQDGVLGCSGISWTIYKQSAPPSRQITTPTPHHSIFTGRMLFVTTNQQDKCIEGRWCDVSCVKIVYICLSYHSYELDGCIIFLVLQK